MTSILKSFRNLASPGPLQVPTGRLAIDWTHPLAKGLIGCWLPGNSMQDISGQVAADLVNFSPSASPRDVTAEGVGVKSAATNSAITQYATTPFKSWTGFSIFWRGYQLGAPAIDGLLLGVSYDDNIDSPYVIVVIATNGNNTNWSLQWNNGAGEVVGTNFTPAIPSNKIYSVGATFNVGGSSKGYQGGVVAASDSFGGVSPISSATSRIIIGSWYGIISGRFSNTINNITAYWNRELSAAEMAWLDRDPYCFVIPQEYEMPILSLGTPSFIPAWARQSNLPVIGGGTF